MKTIDCDLCIVGAGYAALNGLNAAAKYLKKGDRVVMVDKNDMWGGQWVRQYDFVRLHQPYRLFTAGDQPWTLDRDPTHLATRREVLDHLASVPGVSAGHLEVQPLFGHAYTGHRVHQGRVEVDVAQVSDGNGKSTGNGDGVAVQVRARRLLKATGVDIEILKPLPLSSDRMRSVGVADPILSSPEFLDSDAPVHVVGSGKTAMDFVRHVVQKSRNKRPIRILTGSGMWFFVRDNAFVSGLRRHYGGALVADMFTRVALQFDGQNEAAIASSLERDGLLMNVFGQGGNCRFGLLSYSERDEVLAGVTEVLRGHLVDVDGTKMTYREGKELRELQVAEGSWFVNCTSHLRQFPHEAVYQDGGLTCAPQYSMGFTGTTAYFTTHLWFRDELAAVAPQLFRIRTDIEPKLRFLPAACLTIMANMALAGRHLPLSVPAKFLGDFSKWFPMHRQIPTIARIVSSRSKVLEHAERHIKGRFADAPEPN